MKLLTKVKIINWHYFWNETIEIEPIVFLTGLNGSGKSTLIDALEVVLLGDTTGRSFNKAAMEKSSRTLRGYLKGELGDSLDGGFKYLRNGRFTSYIALEFFDDLVNAPYTLGICFDSYDDGSEEHRFFFLDDGIPENEFIVNNLPMDYKTLADYFSINYKDKYRFFDSNRQYQDFLKKKSGGLKDKYFSLLKKSTSFSPITDITTFITEYVCDPQSNLDLTHLQENIIQYKRLENEALAIQKRVDRLEEIDKTYQVFLEHKKNFTISKYIIERCELENSYLKLDSFRSSIEDNKGRILEIDDRLADFSIASGELEKKRVHLIQDKANNSAAKLTQELSEQKVDTERKIFAIKEEVKRGKDSLKAYNEKFANAADLLFKDLKNINRDILDDDKLEEITLLIDECSKTLSLTKEFNNKCENHLFDLTRDDFTSYRSGLSEFKNKVSSLSISLARTIFNIEKKIGSLKDEQLNIKKGNKVYDTRLVNIKTRLESELASRFNKQIRVNIFADLIDIKDLSWSNAIEGYLYNQKFNLFVEPKYYFEAYKILKRLLDEYRYFGTALVDQERIIERNYEIENLSLAEEIKTSDEGARAYTNFLIGRLYKSNTLEAARDSNNGITKDCDLYRNFTFSRINPRLYQESFIGSNLDERFVEEKARQMQNNIANLTGYRELTKIINAANSLEIMSTYEIDNYLDIIKKSSEVSGLEETLSFINSELKEHDTTLIASLDKRLRDVEDDIRDINFKREQIIEEKGALQREISAIKEEKIANEERIIKEREESIKINYDPYLVEEKALPLFNEKRTEKGTLEIFQEFNANLSRLQYLVNNLSTQIAKAKRDYVSEYHLSFDCDKEDGDEFRNELIDFRDVKLPEYQEKIKDSYQKATQQFKDDFIFKLRGAIQDVEDQIENLNEALKQSSFGQDLYRFTVKPSTIYKRYYEMVMDDLILEVGEEETAFVEKYKGVMEDLFKQIVETGEGDKNSLLIDNINKFTDYRSYLDFDLIVYNKDSGEEQRLSKMIKKKSGGETQTPFYIAVLASFAQLYHVNDDGELANTTRLIVFDEAFSKMDRGRIKEAVKLLRKFNLQVVISCPSDKIADITELVDQTLVVLHNKNSSCVRLYSKEK
ncbi:MAG TPA: SbcC/MukB-like Walker B domain-containing protein [Candidatus Onthovivens sp.]|nr:SbcC/MukB-like Walker B domain-containing protein [Candidatus Onthovivens sp.]